MAATKSKTTSATSTTEIDTVVEELKQNTTKPEVKTELPLDNSDEIECTSNIPNVSYLDKKTGDYYKWENVGDTESIPVAVLKDMYRNHTYLQNLIVTVKDGRVIKLFRLEKAYKSYDALLSSKSYSIKEISKIKEQARNLTHGLKRTVATRIITMVKTGELSDTKVLWELEKLFNLELIELVKST
jgi:hypothetical protein